jgi:hypothetical protein
MTSTSRRTVLNAAWATPVISAVATAPAFATSVRNDPGINGWVLAEWDPSDRTPDVSFDSDPAGQDPPTPDGAPFGLYVRNVNRTPQGALADTITNAAITLWMRGTATVQYPEGASTTPNGGGHGRWNLQPGVLTEVKPDGRTYRGYRFAYAGALSTPALVGGQWQVYFEDFSVVMRNVQNSNATFWTERDVTVNGVPLTFQRRAGEDGSFSARAAAAATRKALL